MIVVVVWFDFAFAQVVGGYILVGAPTVLCLNISNFSHFMVTCIKVSTYKKILETIFE